MSSLGRFALNTVIRRLIYLAIAALIAWAAQSARGATANRYRNAANTTTTGYDIKNYHWKIHAGPTTANGSYYVYYRRTRSGYTDLTGTFYVTVSGGLITYIEGGAYSGIGTNIAIKQRQDMTGSAYPTVTTENADSVKLNGVNTTSVVEGNNFTWVDVLSGATGGNAYSVINLYLPGYELEPRMVSFDHTQAFTGANGIRGPFTVTLSINNAVVRTRTIPAFTIGQLPDSYGVNYFEGPMEVTASFAYSWKVNGTITASGSYTEIDEIPYDIVYTSGTYADPYTPPAPTEGEQTTEETTADDGERGGTTTTKTVKDETGQTKTVIGSDVVPKETMNAQAFYDVFKQALSDQSAQDARNKTNGVPGYGENGEEGQVEVTNVGSSTGGFSHTNNATLDAGINMDFTDTGELNNVQGELDLMESARGTEAAKAYVPLTQMKAQVTALGNVNGFGQQAQLVIPTGSSVFGDIVIDLSKPWVAELRRAMLFVMSVGWIGLVVGSARGYL